MARLYNTSPFEIFNKDTDDFILTINTIIKKNDKEENNRSKDIKQTAKTKKTDTKSANGDGFWDF